MSLKVVDRKRERYNFSAGTEAGLAMELDLASQSIRALKGKP